MAQVKYDTKNKEPLTLKEAMELSKKQYGETYKRLSTR